MPFILVLGAARSGHEDSLPRNHPHSWFTLRQARTAWKPHTCWERRPICFDAQACCFLRQRDLHTETQAGLLRGLWGKQDFGFSPQSSGRKCRGWAPSPHLSVLCLFTWVHLTLGTSFALVLFPRLYSRSMRCSSCLQTSLTDLSAPGCSQAAPLFSL